MSKRERKTANDKLAASQPIGTKVASTSTPTVRVSSTKGKGSAKAKAVLPNITLDTLKGGFKPLAMSLSPIDNDTSSTSSNVRYLYFKKHSRKDSIPTSTTGNGNSEPPSTSLLLPLLL
jgi:hypothetical protein